MNSVTQPQERGRRFLLTNDDGVDAPGLSALIRAVEGLGEPCVVAPSGPWSGRGHSVTLDGPIPIRTRVDDRIAIDGSPADCVRLGLHHLVVPTDWVLSGINAGGNLGIDIHPSGTVAAAREAAIQGQPAIALSHYIARGRAVDWDQAARWARGVLERLLGLPWEPGTFWNVNLPHPEPGGPEPEIVHCPVDHSPLPLRFALVGSAAHYQGDYQGRPRRSGGDVAVCFGGRISVSKVPLGPQWHEPDDLAAPGGSRP